MLGMDATRFVELSRPGYARALDEYARLEYPREDPRTVELLARATAGRRTRRVPIRIRLLRWLRGAFPRSAANP